MKVWRLIEIIQKENPDADVVHLVEDKYYPVAQLVERNLTPTQIRNTFTNQLAPGFKEANASDKGKLCIELQH
ncbi:MAG TPA: hypothetical protein VKA70_16255 [Blastocatellia bacterium]|nr:hypothetical protein [Blastocatellia bacterium]